MENELRPDFVGAVQRSLGARVRRLRKLSGWSQSELATQLAIHGVEMHQTTLAKLENGQRPTTAAELVALAAVFQVSFDELLDPDTPLTEGPTLDQLNAAIREQQELMADLQTRLANEQKVLNRMVAAKHMLGYDDGTPGGAQSEMVEGKIQPPPTAEPRSEREIRAEIEATRAALQAEVDGTTPVQSDDAGFELYKDEAGKHSWRLMSRNGAVIATGIPFDSRADAERAMAEVKNARRLTSGAARSKVEAESRG